MNLEDPPSNMPPPHPSKKKETSFDLLVKQFHQLTNIAVSEKKESTNDTIFGTISVTPQLTHIDMVGVTLMGFNGKVLKIFFIKSSENDYESILFKTLCVSLHQKVLIYTEMILGVSVWTIK